MVLPTHPNVLFTFLMGKNANFAENLDENTLKSIALDILQTAFPKYEFPQLLRLIRYERNSYTN